MDKSNILERARKRVAERRLGVRHTSISPRRTGLTNSTEYSGANSDDPLGLSTRRGTAFIASDSNAEHFQSAKNSRKSDLISLIHEGRSESIKPQTLQSPLQPSRRDNSSTDFIAPKDGPEQTFGVTRYRRMSLARPSDTNKEFDSGLSRSTVTGSTGSLMGGTYQRRRITQPQETELSNEVLQETDPDAIVPDEKDTKKKKKDRKKKKKNRHASDVGENSGGDDIERGKLSEFEAVEGRKSTKRGRKSKTKKSLDEGVSDADIEDDSDPFEEFREATEKAELENIETYVAKAKWEIGFDPSHEMNSKLLFHPDKYVFPPSESLTALFETLRFPDEEGLYVGQYPAVKAENLTKMERRLRAADSNQGIDWFGPNQRLAALPVPSRNRTQRPGAPPPMPVAQAAPVTDSSTSLSRSSVSLRYIEDPSTLVEDPFSYINDMGLLLRKPHKTSPYQGITDSPDGYYSLVFSLGSLTFSEHPLMTEECKLAKEVEDWIYTLRARKKTDLVGFLSRKLEAIKMAYTEYVERTERILSGTFAEKQLAEEDGIYPAKPMASKYYEQNVQPREEDENERIRDEDTRKRREFREDIRSTRLLRDAEAHKNRRLEFKIIQAWERIKKLRKKSNLVTTSLRVMVRARPASTTADEDKLEFHRQLEEELLELEEMHDAEMERKRRVYKALLKDWRKKQAAEEEQRAKSDAEKENTPLRRKIHLLGSDADPLADSDDEEKEYEDDNRSGHEWLRESAESIRSKEAWDQRKQERRQKKFEQTTDIEDEAGLNQPRRKSSIWDIFRGRSPSVAKFPSVVNRKASEQSSILDLTLDHPIRNRSMPAIKVRTTDLSAVSSKRSASSVRKDTEAIVDSAFVASPQKQQTPKLRQRGEASSRRKKQETDNDEEGNDVIASKSSLGSQSSLKMGEDVRKWRSASRDALDQTIKLRRPSTRPPSPIRSVVPKSVVAAAQSPMKLPRKSVSINPDAISAFHESEGHVRRKSSKAPKSPKNKGSKKRGASAGTDSMPSAPDLVEFNAEKARKEVAKRLDASMRPPGAPILSISHVFTEHQTEFLQCTKEEQLRRRQMESTTVYACIYYNGKEVTRTMPQPIDNDKFSVSFKGIETIAIDESPLDSIEPKFQEANIFGVRVKEKPDSIKIEFHEIGNFGNCFIGEVFVPVPDPSETVWQHDRAFKSIAFSGRPFFQRYTTSNEVHSTNKWIEGTIKLDVAWGVGEDGQTLGPQVKPFCPAAIQGNSKYTDPLCVAGDYGLLNLRKLMDWIMDIKFDPNDPRNADILRMKQLVQMGGCEGLSFHEYWSQRKYFRLHIPSKISQMTLGLGVDCSNTKRITLLKKRYRKEVNVKCPVPLEDKDITDDIFEKIANPLEDDATALALWKPKGGKFENADDAGNLGFLKRIRMHQLIQRARQARPPRVEDYVREERLAEVQIQENTVLAMFMPKRPLKPNRMSRLSLVTAQPENGCKIICHILQGFNIPVRKHEHNLIDEKNKPSVRSYVEVSFQGRKNRTSVFEGPSPHWNETVQLELTPPNNDFKPESLLDSEIGMERIYFNLFDELLVDIIDDDRDRELEIHQRRERNWIGSFSIPFTALYEQARIDGSFHVQIPTVLLGYEKNPSAGPLDNALFLALEATKETLLDVFITLEPPLLQPSPLKLKFLSDETERFLRYANHWSKSPFLHPNRPFLATALDLSGRSTFICRYIRPQDPPEELLTPRHLLRFVSSIPYLPDRTAFSADVSLWATSDQMLELCAGDAAEHAILLCNFLLAKGGENIEAYVVIGNGIPEGRTAYVAMRIKTAGASKEMTLLNAITGQSYSTRDSHLPLKVVGCIFNDSNIWANIQPHDDPARVDWDISSPKFWKPFFCRSFPKTEYKSVQIEKLHFKEVSARYCQELENLIEKSVVSKMEEWRAHRITRWNRLASKSLKPLVSRLEADLLQPLPPNTPQHLTPLYQALAPLKNVYRISGFPLHTTFTDVKDVVELVGATDVHMNADPSAEFALSVWCGGYPGGFISVWIYVCSLTRGKNDML